MLRCLCSDLDEVSQAVLPFLNSYATKLRTTAKRNRVLDEVGVMFVLGCRLMYTAMLAQQKRMLDEVGATLERGLLPSRFQLQPSTGTATFECNKCLFRQTCALAVFLVLTLQCWPWGLHQWGSG